jgi:hypothetical protein
MSRVAVLCSLCESDDAVSRSATGEMLCAICAGLAEAPEPFSVDALRCAVPQPPPSPTPTNAEARDVAEVDALLAQRAAGEIEPVPVYLPALPTDANPSMRKVAKFFALVRGLRLAVDDDRPVIFGVAWVAGHLGWTEMRVSRALQKLRAPEVGVLQLVGSMPGRGGRRGTHLYVPGSGPHLPGLVERGSGNVAGERVEPVGELVDLPLVAGAELAVPDRDVDAPGDGTVGGVGGLLGHNAEPTPRVSGNDPAEAGR